MTTPQQAPEYTDSSHVAGQQTLNLLLLVPLLKECRRADISLSHALCAPGQNGAKFLRKNPRHEATDEASGLAEDDAVLHDEGDAGEDADVVEGIAGDGDDVSVIAGLMRANFVLPAQQFGAVEQVGLQRV